MTLIDLMGFGAAVGFIGLVAWLIVVLIFGEYMDEGDG